MNFDYPAPIEDPAFNVYWDKYVDNLVHRENFKAEHLDQLAILCRMYVELDEIEEEIRLMGRSYRTSGRHGDQIKVNPLVKVAADLRSEIRNYNKMLGLLLEKDKKMKDTTTKNEWMSGGTDEDSDI